VWGSRSAQENNRNYRHSGVDVLGVAHLGLLDDAVGLEETILSRLDLRAEGTLTRQSHRARDYHRRKPSQERILRAVQLDEGPVLGVTEGMGRDFDRRGVKHGANGAQLRGGAVLGDLGVAG